MIKVRGGESGVGGALSTRLGYLCVDPNGEQGGNNDFQRGLSGSLLLSNAWNAVGAGLALARTGGNQQVDGFGIWRFRPTLANGNGHIFRGGPGGAVPTGSYNPMDFRDTFDTSGADLAGTPGQPNGMAYCTIMQAWLRKDVDGELCSARMHFGWANVQAFANMATLRPVPRVGLFGDGANGFLFGSVGCPDGAAVGQTGLADRDAGFVQPIELVNPNDKWFHVRIGLYPATPNGRRGLVACYLNGRLVVTYQTLTNMPRGHAGVGTPAASWGSLISPLVLAGFDAGTQLAGWVIRKFEIWHDLDLTL